MLVMHKEDSQNMLVMHQEDSQTRDSNALLRQPKPVLQYFVCKLHAHKYNSPYSPWLLPLQEWRHCRFCLTSNTVQDPGNKKKSTKIIYSKCNVSLRRVCDGGEASVYVWRVWVCVCRLACRYHHMLRSRDMRTPLLLSTVKFLSAVCDCLRHG